MSEIRMTLDQKVIDDIIAKNPEMEVQIANKILDETAKRIIKKVLNNEDILDKVQVRLAAAIDALVQEAGVAVKKAKGIGYGARTYEVLKPSLKEKLMPKIEKEIKLHVRAEAEQALNGFERLNDVTEDAVRRAMYKVCRSSEMMKMLKPHIVEVSKQVIREHLGME
jgi:hypothetical protein